MLAVALVSVGVGIVGGGLLSRVDAPWAPIASSLTLWVGFAVAIGFAFARSRPIGLLRFRPVDVLFGVGVGLALRGMQGAVAGVAPFPTAAMLDSSLPASWWLTDALPAVLVAPVLEEFLFRGVLLVVVYQLLRRAAGSLAAGFAALLVSTGAFILVHAIGGTLSVADAVVFGAVGLTCGLLVLLTGRVWGAVLTHVVFNAAYVVLVVVGTALS